MSQTSNNASPEPCYAFYGPSWLTIVMPRLATYILPQFWVTLVLLAVNNLRAETSHKGKPSSSQCTVKTVAKTTSEDSVPITVQ